MKTFAEARQALIDNAKNNVVTTTVKNNPVASTCAATYIAGSTIAYTAAGVAFKTALAYSVGVCAVYGALAYGAHHIIKKANQ